MAQSGHLISVIQSLSKSEKRYFKLQCKTQEGSKAYLTLFELLDTKKPDDISVKKKFEKIFLGSAYDAAQKHLYKILMRSLRNYETNKTPEDQLINIIADVKILLNKGLLEVGFAEIERGKKIALTYEKFFYYLLLARMELQHLTLAEFPNVDENVLLEKQEKINSLLYEELYINKHASLHELLMHRYILNGEVRSDGEREKLNDLLLEEFQVNANQRYHNFQTDKLHLHFQSAYFLMTGEPEQSLQEFYKLNTLFENNQARWKDEPLYYIYLLNGILSTLRSVRDHNEMNVFINRLKSLFVNTKGNQHLVHHLVFQHSAAILIDEGKFNEGSSHFNRFIKDGGILSNVSLNVLASTQLFTAILFFGDGNYRKAMVHINEVQSLPEAYISRHTYVVARLLFLLIHLELGNEDILTYAIKSLERKLKSIKILYQTEKITMDFLKKKIGVSKAKQKTHEEEFALQLRSITDSRYERTIFQTFDLLAWIHSKINKISFADQVQANFRIGK